MVDCDRGLHNRGQFAAGLAAHSVYLRQAPVETPEYIGRGERHGGIIKSNMRAIIKSHQLVGKAEMKLCAAVAQENKKQMCRKVGIAPDGVPSRGESSSGAVPAAVANPVVTPLEEVWNRTAPDLQDPGRRLVRSLAQRPDSAEAESATMAAAYAAATQRDREYYI